MGSVGVVVAHHDPGVAERVAELLERAPDLFVAATSIQQARAGNVVIAGGEPLSSMGRVPHPLVVLAEERAVLAGRRAIELAAREIVAWPGEADRLAGAVRRAAAPSSVGAALGRTVAVAGARGGLGVTSVAATLASTLADAIVVDLSHGAGQRAFCDGEPTHTVHGLAVTHADPPPEVVEAALQAHAGGARCLHARPFAELPSSTPLVVRAVRSIAPTVVIDAGVIGSDATRAANADVWIVLVGNDVASVRAALAGAPEGATFVVRRVRRGGVPVRDVAAALGIGEPVVVPHDPVFARAVDLGGLPGRGRALKRLTALARSLS